MNAIMFIAKHGTDEMMTSAVKYLNGNIMAATDKNEWNICMHVAKIGNNRMMEHFVKKYLSSDYIAATDKHGRNVCGVVALRSNAIMMQQIQPFLNREIVFHRDKYGKTCFHLLRDNDRITENERLVMENILKTVTIANEI